MNATSRILSSFIRFGGPNALNSLLWCSLRFLRLLLLLLAQSNPLLVPPASSTAAAVATVQLHVSSQLSVCQPNLNIDKLKAYAHGRALHDGF
jgi:hypothetical protein